MRLFFVLLCLSIAGEVISASAADEHDPATELASFQIASGFEVSLFASEKDGVVKPIQIRFDPQGRIWCIGSSVYPQIEPGQTPNDKILVLEDTDHDGKCDKVTVFADGLTIPTGLELGDGGAYVGVGTELLFLKDTNGDLQADERRVVLRGFGTGDNHQNINSFLWGPGGELWFCQGLHTHSNVETPWGIVRMNQAGLWRFRPRLKKLEGFYGSAYEPQNPWGYVFTEWGESIVIAGNNSSPIYSAPGLTARHLDLPPSIIWKNGQGRKSSGADIVGTTHFPEDWQGTIITGGYINNSVWALRLLDDGSGFSLEDREPLIRSTIRNFRPVDVKFGPDGALYICDWYNPIIGHYQASFRHPDRDKVHGRIWRVTAKGRPLTAPPQLVNASIPALLEDLKAGDRWTRQFAKRVLAEKKAEEIVGAVKQWLAENSPTDLALKEALGVLESHEAVDEALVRLLAIAKSPGARAYAATAVARWADRLQDPLSILRPLAGDTNARVRLQAIVASSYVETPQSIDIAATATGKETDKFIDYALRQTVFALKEQWLGRVPECETNAELRGLLLQYGGGAELLGHLRQAVRTDAPDSQGKRMAWKILLENGNGDDLMRLCQIPDAPLRDSLFPSALAAVHSRMIAPPQDTQPLLQLVRANDANALRLAGEWRLQTARPQIETVLRDRSQSAELRAAAAVALIHYDAAGAASLAGEFASDLSEHWKDLFTGFAEKKSGLHALAVVFGKTPPPPQVATAILRAMTETGRSDEELRQVLTPLNAGERKLTLADIPGLLDEIRMQGDARRGEQVLRRPELGCLTCHAVKGQGGTIGPDLGALGTAQPVEFIVGAILEPQKEVKEGYLAVAITTKDGDEYQGYPQRETASQVVIRDLAQNSVVSIDKARIAQNRPVGSPMPSGLADAMSRKDFADLVRYLSELGK